MRSYLLNKLNINKINLNKLNINKLNIAKLNRNKLTNRWFDYSNRGFNKKPVKGPGSCQAGQGEADRARACLWRSGLVCGILSAALFLSACSMGGAGSLVTGTGAGSQAGESSPQEFSKTDFVMDTVFQAKIYGREDLTGDIHDLLKDLEEKELSWRIDDSEIARVNKDSSQGGKESSLSQDFCGWTAMSLDLAVKSQGSFDPTIGMLTRLWDIEGDNPSVPSEEEIAAALGKAGWEKVHLDEAGLTLKMDDGCTLDFGATGKGIGCDRVADFLKDQKDIAGAVVSIGGSNLVYGSKPDGQPWKVAIQDPRGLTGELMAYISLEGTHFVSTSGDYEKYFEEDGKRYHHILDPHTGYPADSGLISVTVICDSGLLSDGLSTACFVLGREKALDLLDLYGAEGILVDQDKNVYVTEGIRDTYNPMASGYKLVD